MTKHRCRLNSQAACAGAVSPRRGPEPGSLFDAVRHISAADAAQRAGLPVVRRGSRFWARCPFHGERTPSLCLYDEPERGWVCYGCHKGGDSVALYAGLYSLGMADAARKLAADFGITVPKYGGAKAHTTTRPTAHMLRRALEKCRNRDYDRMCRAVHKANLILEQFMDDSAWDDPRFTSALRVREKAEIELDWLQKATIPELTRHYKNEVRIDELPG